MQQAIAKAVRDGYDRLIALKDASEPGVEQFELKGGCVFLGSHLRSNGILMLGLNPGSMRDDEDPDMDTGLAKENWLLGSPEEADIYRYWRMARRCFGGNAALKNAMEKHATFSFCIPYRTPSWNGKAALRDALFRESQPSFKLLLEATTPKVVIVAGQAARSLFLWHVQEMQKPNALTVSDEKAIHVSAPLQKLGRSTVEVGGRSIALIRTPHFSRTSIALMENSSAALTSELAAQGLIE